MNKATKFFPAAGSATEVICAGNLPTMPLILAWGLLSLLLQLQPLAAADESFNFRRLKSFGVGDAASPQAQLIEGSDGALYGTTYLGGIGYNGTIIKLGKDGGGYSILHRFGDRAGDGLFPAGRLLEAKDGVLYGVTSMDEINYAGTVFKINKDGSGYAILWRFGAGEDGGDPEGALIQAADGALYGTTAGGGASQKGTIFTIKPDGSGYKSLHQFGDPASDGDSSNAALLEGSDGFLYGATSKGGDSDNGVVFKIAKDGTGYVPLRRFAGGDDGGNPQAGLVEGKDGVLYGTTSGSAGVTPGTIFKLGKDGGGYSVLRRFTRGEDDYFSGGSLFISLGAGDLLYGTTAYGGAKNLGTIFKMGRDGSGYSLLYQFSGSEGGGVPLAPVIEGSDGMLYGAAGGKPFSDSDPGSVFRLKKDGSGFELLRKFQGSAGADGGFPLDTLIEGSDGALYGVGNAGGVAGRGALFRVRKDGGEYAVLHHFMGSADDASDPLTSLIEGTNGVLYGTALGNFPGRPNENGTLFRLNKDGSGFSVMHAFAGGDDGANPQGALLQASNGVLYGTTGGDTTSRPTLFRINPAGDGYSVIRNMAPDSDGKSPGGALIEASDGLLYGTTAEGGRLEGGTLFRFAKDGTGFQLLLTFDPDGAYNPLWAVLEGSDGSLYGTLYFGGAGGAGAVFKVNKDGKAFRLLHEFDGADGDGAQPQNALVEGSDGMLYGTTSSGGLDDGGIAFRLGKNGAGYQIMHTFNATYRSGASPNGLLLASDGAFYGSTVGGGDAGVGILYKLFGGPPPPLKIESLTLSPNGAKLLCSGAVGAIIRLEAATTLDHPAWESLGSGAIDLDGTARFIDPSNHPVRFYQGIGGKQP